jgi:antitoxin ParD1/3/4
VTDLVFHLPQHLADWIAAKAASGEYIDAGDYLRDLVRRDEARAARIAAMDRLVEEGLESGVNALSIDKILAAARKA